jgi:hypothetical protein
VRRVRSREDVVPDLDVLLAETLRKPNAVDDVRKVAFERSGKRLFPGGIDVRFLEVFESLRELPDLLIEDLELQLVEEHGALPGALKEPGLCIRRGKHGARRERRNHDESNSSPEAHHF